MLSNKSIIFLILLILISIQSRASHILGGEMELMNLSGNRYELKLRLYYDGLNGQDVVEDTIIVTSFRKFDHQKIENFKLIRNPDFQSPDITNSLCKEGLNIRIYTYRQQIFLEPGVYNALGGYYFSWQRCCRSNNVSNAPGSGTAGFVFYMEFPDMDTYQGNSAAVFPSLSGDYYCIGENVEINFKAEDSNGDILKYSLVTPLQGFSSENNNVIIGQSGPYPLINNYNAIPSFNGLEIDSLGVVKFRPSSSGLFLIAVRCEEYRGGVKIGEVRREITIVIRDCEANAPPQLSFYPYGNDSLYSQGDTILIRNSEDLCHTFVFSDPDEGGPEGEMNFVTFKYLSPGLGDPSIAPLDSIGQNTYQLCFPSCENPENNFFRVRLTVSDDHCPVPASDFLDINFMISESEDLPPIITSDYVETKYLIGDEIEFNVWGYDVDSAGIGLRVVSNQFNPSDLMMDFLVISDECCNAEGTFKWVPTCTTLLDFDSYELLFIAEGKNCGFIGRDTLKANLFVERPKSEPFDFDRMANVLTPNSDGFNDEFGLPPLNTNSCALEEFQRIEIYNRWGRKVYESTDPQFLWSPEELSVGQYFYLLSFNTNSYKGFIHLLR